MVLTCLTGAHFTGFAPFTVFVGLAHLLGGGGGGGFSRLRLAFSAIAVDTSPSRPLVLGTIKVDPALIRIPLGMPFMSRSTPESTPKVFAACSRLSVLATFTAVQDARGFV